MADQPQPPSTGADGARPFMIVLDSNALDPAGSEAQAAAEIHRLILSGRLRAVLPDSVRVELEHPVTPDKVRQRAAALPPVPYRRETIDDMVTRHKVDEVLRGKGRAGRHAADAHNLTQAAAYADTFVTCDKRLLERRRALCAVLPGLQILRPSELLDRLQPPNPGPA